MTNNCWCSVDPHFQDVVGCLCQFILITKDVNTSKINRDVPMSIFKIISSISEYDHKCETRNAEREIRTDGSTQPRPHLRVNGYVSEFCPPRVSGSGIWMGLEPNRPVFVDRTWNAGRLPAPIPNISQKLKKIFLWQCSKGIREYGIYL